MNPPEKHTYEAAHRELQDIVQRLQDEAISIDELTAQTRRAAELIKFCRQKLRDTEIALQQLFEEEED